MSNWKSFDFGLELKRNSGSENNKSNVCNNITPKSVNDLAVNLKKIKELGEWLRLNALNTNKELKCSFLLISGPAGCGKTITLNVLCKEMKISVLEWINAVDRDYMLLHGSSQINRFKEFLIDSKWQSLCGTPDKNQITLIKDFPNAFIHQPQEFFNVLHDCYGRLKCPVVFICTDTNNSCLNLTRILFTDDIKSQYNIAHISFNACATSLLKKAIKRAQSIIQENGDSLKQLSPTTIDAIISTSMGDIRNLMSQFYFACLLDSKDSTSEENRVKVINKKSKSVGSMSRNEYLGLFHGLGKVLNPKREQRGNSWRFNFDQTDLVEEFSTQPYMFISFLFENYLKYFGTITDASNAAQVLSFAMCYLDSLSQKLSTINFALWIAVFGLMAFNEHKISKWNQIRSPTNCYNKICIPKSHPTDEFYFNIIKGIGCNKLKNHV